MSRFVPCQAALGFALLLVACGPSSPSVLGHEPGHDLAEGLHAITWNGSQWQPTAAVLVAGDQQQVTYNGSPTVGSYCTSTNPWACSCGAHPSCSAGLPGTLAFATYLKNKYPQISSTGGLGSCCRQSTGGTGQYLSVHSLGRAIDIMIPETAPGVADNARGDPIAAWLIQNAQAIGIQYIAWDQAQWSTSKSPGNRYGPYTGSLSHTDHLHVELNLAAANKQTPFFAGGIVNQPTQNCTARCNGSIVIQADCSTGDCAAYGATCIADPNPRCVYAQCPPAGTAKVCLDSSRIANCNNGLPSSVGDCSAFGCFCSTAGVAPTAARCVLSLCVPGPSAVPVAHVGCSITTGKKLDCDANGAGTEVACPSGQVCSMEDGTARCVAPRAECPAPAAGAVVDKMVCLQGGKLARCFNGNLIDADECGDGSICSDASGVARCVSAACAAAGNPASFCTPEGARAGCDERGMLTFEEGCPAGTACTVGPSGAACEASGGGSDGGTGGGSDGGTGGGSDGGTGGGAGGGSGAKDGGTDIIGAPPGSGAGWGCQGSAAGGAPVSALALLVWCVRRWVRRHP
jgi:hypothetical protein